MIIGFFPLILFWCGLPLLAVLATITYGRLVIIPMQILTYHEKALEFFEQRHPKLCHVLKTMWYAVKPTNAVDPFSHESSNEHPTRPTTSGASVQQPGMTKQEKQLYRADRSVSYPRIPRIGASLPQPTLSGQGEHLKTMDTSVTHGNIEQEARSLPQSVSVPKEINNMAQNAQQRWRAKAPTSKEMTSIQID